MLIGTEKTIPSKHYLDCRSVSKKIAAELKPLYFEESIILQQHIFTKIIYSFGCCCSVAQLHPTLQPHRLHQAKFLCPSPSPEACSNLYPLNWWCHSTISSSVIPFSTCCQYFPASGFFQWVGSLHQFPKHWNVSFSISPSNEYSGWVPLGLASSICLLSKGLSRVFSSITGWKHQFFLTQSSLGSKSHIHTWLLEKSSVQFSRSVMSDSLWPHEPQHARPPCPSLTSRVHPDPCPLNRWCHPTVSSSVVPFSSCPHSFPASGSFQMSQLFTSGGQSIGVSASTSVLPMNTQDWSPLGWTGWTSLQSKGLSRVFSSTTVQKYQVFGAQFSL